MNNIEKPVAHEDSPPSTETYLLGIDLGASDLKLNVISNLSLEVVAEVRFPIQTSHPQTGWAEQNPLDWELALIQAISMLHQQFSVPDIKALSITAGAHIPVLLDANDKVLRPAILWSDQRSAACARELARNPRFVRESLNQPQATWTASMLRWLTLHEPEVFAKATTILPAKDYLRFLLTGEKRTDPTDVIGFLLGKALGTAWSADLCDAVGVNPAQLPPVHPCLSLSKPVSERAAHRFNLVTGTPVVTGAMDTSVELISSTQANAEQAINSPTGFTPHYLIKMASAGVVYQTTNTPTPQPPASLYPGVTDGFYYYAAGMNSCATSLRWMTNILLGEKTPTPMLFELAADSIAGANGVLALPYFLGERAPIWEANLSAAFLGISHLNHRADLAQAVIEGTCFALKDVYQSIQAIDQAESQRNDPITIIGGGANAPLWTQTLASILNQPLEIAPHSDAAYGAALVAGLATGHIVKSQMISQQRQANIIAPKADDLALYEDRWQAYKRAQAFLLRELNQ